MTLRDFIFALAIGACAVAYLPAHGAADAALLRDLSSVIALLGVPCGKVVSATRQSDNDHVATCQDGSRYRVHLDAAGRVVADKV